MKVTYDSGQSASPPVKFFFPPEPDHRLPQSTVMPRDLQNNAVFGKKDHCVATNQKAVYDWYETHHSDDDVVDIYSPEWQQRVTSWHKLLVRTHGPKHVYVKLVELYTPEEIEFRIFFFAHPIATFSLWHVFEAFYELDKTICGTSSEADPTLAQWQQMKPFKYLKSEEVQRRWKTELKRLDKEIGCGDLTGERLKSRMYHILRGVERLEYSLELLEEDLCSDGGKIEYAEWISETARNAFDERCFMIAETLKTGVNGYVESMGLPEVEGSYGDNLGSST